MRLKWKGLLAAAPFALVAVSLGMDASGGATTTPNGCLRDAAKLCKGVKPGGGRVLECMARKHNQLSPRCKTAMAPIKPHIIAWRNACGTDIDQHCSTLPPTAVMLNCLGAHWSTLRSTCKTKIGEAVVWRALVCAKDTKEHCSKVSPGAGRVVECLHKHRGSLELECRKQVDHEAKWVVPWRQACGSDADQLCSSAKTAWQLLACFDKNKSKVSAPCKAKVAKLTKSWGAICARDINKYCNGVQPGNGRMVTCLHKHRLQLRPACKARVP